MRREITGFLALFVTYLPGRETTGFQALSYPLLTSEGEPLGFRFYLIRFYLEMETTGFQALSHLYLPERETTWFPV